MSALELAADDVSRLTDLTARMAEIKERTNALEAEYSQLRDEVIGLSGIGHRRLPNGCPVQVSSRRAFDPRRAVDILTPEQVASILLPPKVDPKLARVKLSQADYERCLADTVTYNVRIG